MCLQVCLGARGSHSAAAWCTSAGSDPAPVDSAPPPVDSSDKGRRWRSMSIHLHHRHTSSGYMLDQKICSTNLDCQMEHFPKLLYLFHISIQQRANKKCLERGWKTCKVMDEPCVDHIQAKQLHFLMSIEPGVKSKAKTWSSQRKDFSIILYFGIVILSMWEHHPVLVKLPWLQHPHLSLQQQLNLMSLPLVLFCLLLGFRCRWISCYLSSSQLKGSWQTEHLLLEVGKMVSEISEFKCQWPSCSDVLVMNWYDNVHSTVI